tara:strand:- start:2528 stop:3028 length:501 start_codon:yes stop_codon:yes gene_type:complete
MSEKIYPTLTAIPRVKVGDIMFRLTLVNQYEEAMVVSILSPNETAESWSATLMTKNGIEYVTGHVENRSVHSWMPKGWKFNKERMGWIPPQSILRDDSKEAVIEDPVEAVKVAESLIVEVPTPWADEKYMTWRARVLKTQPRLKGDDEIYTKLSAAWKEKQYEITI